MDRHTVAGISNSDVLQTHFDGISPLRSRLRAAGFHLILSVLVSGLIAAVVMPLWYPGAYQDVAGGGRLLLLVMSVNVCLGPLVTLAVFDIRKSRLTLRHDMAIVAFLQMAALIYGVSVAAEARPVGMVFAVDRFTVVAANRVRQAELRVASPEFQALPWGGPLMIATRQSSPGETLEAVSMAAEGYDLAQRPSYWRAYSEVKDRAYQRGGELKPLLAHHGISATKFCKSFLPEKCRLEALRFLPVEAPVGDWVALLDPSGGVVALVPLDGFVP